MSSNLLLFPFSGLIYLLIILTDARNPTAYIRDRQTLPKTVPLSAKTVFGEFSGYSRAHGNAIDLGLGAPDWPPPKFVLESAQAANSDYRNHQYCRTEGHPKLVTLLASTYSSHLQRNIDPLNEVAITGGASEGLYLSFKTLLKPGDEVLMFEPFFSLYEKQVRDFGAIPVFLKLHWNDSTSKWAFEEKEVEESMKSKNVKILLLNSPHNPTGKVFTLQEMEFFASLLMKYKHIKVVSDEVYKYTIDDQNDDGNCAPHTPKGHVHFAGLSEEMWKRTITISSAGKTFSVTGWSVGWAIGPSSLIAPIHYLLPNLHFCVPTPVQVSLASALKGALSPYESFSSYYAWLRSIAGEKQRLVANALSRLRIKPRKGEAGFFIIGDISKLENHYSHNDEMADWTFCRGMAKQSGVVILPLSAFLKTNPCNSLVRLATCKTAKLIKEAEDRISSHIQLRPSKSNCMSL